MPHSVLKPTVNNIISLWFGVDTPLRASKIKLNADLWAACEQVHVQFVPPSGALSVERYRRSDLVAFAQAVRREVSQLKLHR